MRNMRWPHYESDETEFTGAFQVAGWRGVAFHVLGWELAPDKDSEWTGIEDRTGKVVAVMVGDDARHVLNREDIAPLKRGEYCGGCGQIGCGHNPGGEDE